MQRIGSAFSGRLRLLFVVLFFVVWHTDDALTQMVGASRVWSLLHLGTIGSETTETLTAAGAFLADAFSFIASTTAGVFRSLPPTVRDLIPTGILSRFFSGLAALFAWDSMRAFGAAIVHLALLLIRFLITLNVVGWLYNLGRLAIRYLVKGVMVPVRFYSERETDDSGATTAPVAAGTTLAQEIGQRRREYVEFFAGHIERIGIILPGGGARGVYQAGALKAVYDFLRQYNALSKVKMVAATSTGAWNAMFWLTGLMDSAKPRAVTLETWWKENQFSQLIDFPWFWIPFVTNFHYRPGPWREQFADLFRKRLDPLFVGSPATHFYFTRTDVRLGALGYSTNWSGVKQVIEKLGVDKQDGYRFIDVIEADGDQLRRTTDAVFASLGQAPLLPGDLQGGRFEDGDAIDPVPLRFATPIENCDLVFVLPSYGPLETEGRSLEDRMRRLVHLQRGALERAALKNADTINRVAERFERLQFGAETIASNGQIAGIAEDAVSGVHEEIEEFNRVYKRLYLFTAGPTGKVKIPTAGYGHRRLAADAFDLMYAQTLAELQHRFFEDIEPEDSQVVMIDGFERGDAGNPVKPSYRRAAQL
jgi:hypothetical protein